jgi:VWFA-related protein
MAQAVPPLLFWDRYTIGNMPGRYVSSFLVASLGMVFCQEAPPGSDLRIRVSVDLVQIDVTVTGARGAHVPGLAKDDFELFLDGHPQPITNFGYVAVPASPRSPQASTASVAASSTKPQIETPPAPAVRLRPEEVRRSVVLFVDDVSMAAESVPAVRNGLHKAIEKEVGPGDLTAIVRASAGMGALQDFTTDKQRLLAAADQVRWSPKGRGALSAYDRIQGPVEQEAQSSVTSSNSGDQNDVAETNFRKGYFLNFTIESLKRVINGMADLPGRKAVVVLSDDLTVAFRDPGTPDAQQAMHIYDRDQTVMDQLRKCADAAARAGVVVYAVDTRGIASLRALAVDDIDHPERFTLPGHLQTDEILGPDSLLIPSRATHSGDIVVDATQGRVEAHEIAQQGGYYLAAATGGLVVPESNDIGTALHRIYSDVSGYYVLAFHPPDDSFERYANGELKFHQIRVRVRRPGLHARTRAGFLGESAAVAGSSRRAELRLVDSLATPFGAAEIPMEMHAVYLQSNPKEPLIHVSLFVNADRLSLSGPEINRSATLHLLLRAFNVDGAAMDGGIDRVLRVSLNRDGYQRAKQYGLLYCTSIPAGKPGPYEVRAAVLDQGGGAIGSANELVEIPKPAKELALSGILFQNWLSKEDDITPAYGASAFHAGEAVPFVVEVFGPPEAGRPKVQATLFRDGVALPGPMNCAVEQALKGRTGGLMVRSRLMVPEKAVPGDYAVRLLVTEGSEGAAARRAIEWASFRVE